MKGKIEAFYHDAKKKKTKNKFKNIKISRICTVSKAIITKTVKIKTN